MVLYFKWLNMKLKEQEVEKEGMNKELYDLFIEMIQFEYNKMSFLKGAKIYCWVHGLQDCANFFKEMIGNCSRCKDDFVYYLLTHFEKVPSITIDAIETGYDSARDAFSEFAKREDDFIELLEKTVKKAKEVTDIEAEAFLLPMVSKIDHIACRALEAVKNDKNPLDLVRSYCCENYIPR